MSLDGLQYNVPNVPVASYCLHFCHVPIPFYRNLKSVKGMK